MIPIRDDNPQLLTPITTIGLIALNCCAWILVQGMGAEPALSTSVCQFALVPGDLLGSLPPGSSFPAGPGTVCHTGSSPAWFTLFSSMFMHGSWLHVIGNMWFLWIFGNNVEDAMGHVRFLVFYLICGLAAAGLQLTFTANPAIPMIGASGAIGGVMGAYILLYPRVQVHMLIFLGFFITTIAVPAVVMLGYWLLIQLLGGFSSITGEGGGVAFWAHVGGFCAGALLSYVFRNRSLLARHPYHGWKNQSPYRHWQRIGGRGGRKF
ncbi:MAG: rhomboid family intramembrane serine protease [Gammaproteobacteria bacterium]|nr:rhomboid family intramembrane serine protease [Pseudomonadales bacterium]MCP5348531.1 rhomboid family intramembrane serine protease [Pseudomonadales bacterium]